MNKRPIQIRRALLQVLQLVPSGLLLPDDVLRADASRMVVPKPVTAELDLAIGSADKDRLVTGVTTEEGTKWKLAPAGEAWLAEHP